MGNHRRNANVQHKYENMLNLITRKIQTKKQKQKQ